MRERYKAMRRVFFNPVPQSERLLTFHTSLSFSNVSTGPSYYTGSETLVR